MYFNHFQLVKVYFCTFILTVINGIKKIIEKSKSVFYQQTHQELRLFIIKTHKRKA